ncbi:hypothetical protein C7N43_20175 [Sphingobacteriales bacterium UPWRP_1]|nr:hypothetical protein B6N25_01840 [Sphingobacteriales bacterium TSM_CSS]PSJ75192.1 hypothetical protein C7N43_20175 [Sphingobacteriales bacterium UPWRP_1]
MGFVSLLAIQAVGNGVLLYCVIYNPPLNGQLNSTFLPRVIFHLFFYKTKTFFLRQKERMDACFLQIFSTFSTSATGKCYCAYFGVER